MTVLVKSNKPIILGQNSSQQEESLPEKVKPTSEFDGVSKEQTRITAPIYELIHQRKLAELQLSNLTKEALTKMEAIMDKRREKQCSRH